MKCIELVFLQMIDGIKNYKKYLTKKIKCYRYKCARKANSEVCKVKDATRKSCEKIGHFSIVCFKN